jgi:hypothetical protein
MVHTFDRIEGGFVLVSAASLMAAWRACRSRPLGIGDFRTWLACRELEARRCGLERGRAPAYGFAELAKLLGVTEKRARGSVARLIAARLLEWSAQAIEFPDHILKDEELVADSIGKGKGSVAIPRRMLRLLAGGARPAIIATTLAILLRCLSRRKGGFDGRGRLKASWVAHVFAVEISRVKLARAELVDLGWIEAEPTDQWAMNRWGKAYRINLEWDRVSSGGRQSPPPRSATDPQSPPPCLDPEPLRETKDQDPAGRRPDGVQIEGQGRQRPEPAHTDPRPTVMKPVSDLPAPTLYDVRSEDLRDVDRTLKLYDQAVARGLASPSEDGRLKFLAVAEHARAVGTTNPGGLFARLVRRGWWHFATQDDEDIARRRLRDHLHGRGGASDWRATIGNRFQADGVGSGPSAIGSLLGRLLSSGEA